MKEVMRSFHHMLEASLIEKAVKALNPELVIRDHCLDSAGMGKSKLGGGTSGDMFKPHEKDEVRDEIRELNPFNEDCGREKITYKGGKYRTCWDDLTDQIMIKFVEDQKQFYDLCRKPNYE
jgi:hypothetical protein